MADRNEARYAPEEAAVVGNFEGAWRSLDNRIRTWWAEDLVQALEPEIRAAPQEGLLFLPKPYLTPGGGHRAVFPEMYAWDSYFINCGLLAHGLTAIVRHHLENCLFQIDRFGYLPNGNRRALATRSQLPVYVDGIWRYYKATGDGEILTLALPRLRRERELYWLADHHATPVGLATNRDLGDPGLPRELASEAETFDWTPIYGGDVRRCAPLATNCALVRYDRTLAAIAAELGEEAEAVAYGDAADVRAERIRSLCWDERRSLFGEYRYVDGSQLPYVSDSIYWALWAGVATPEQAEAMLPTLNTLEGSGGVCATDRVYPDPHPPGMLGVNDLQWMYPVGWPPTQMIAVWGLDAYGYHEAAERIARSFLSLVVEQYGQTGELWEKYNVVDRTLNVPNRRYGVLPMRGWTAASVAVLGRRVFNEGLGS